MKIAAIECLQADTGHRNHDSLKIATDGPRGLVGTRQNLRLRSEENG